jgi:hypothetical protein
MHSTMTENTTPIPAPEKSSDDLLAALARANVQLAELDASIAGERVAHRAAIHAALMAGTDAPAPPKALAGLCDHRESLTGARDAIAAQHKDRLTDERRWAAEDAVEKAGKIREEYARRVRLAHRLCVAAFRMFVETTGARPDEGLLTREVLNHEANSGYAQACAELAGLRVGLHPDFKSWVPNMERPSDYTSADRDVEALVANHVSQLFT